MSMQVGLTNNGSEAQSDISKPSETLKVFRALSGSSCEWARGEMTRAAAKSSQRTQVFMSVRSPILRDSDSEGRPGFHGLPQYIRWVQAVTKKAGRCFFLERAAA